MSLVNSFLFAPFLTIVIELVVALFFGLRKKVEIITIVFVNLLTNTILNYLLLANDQFSFFRMSLSVILFLELLVVLIEWRLLVYTLQEKSKKMLALSLVMNFCSYIAGVLIFGQF